MFLGAVASSAVLALVAAVVVVRLEDTWNANYRGSGTGYVAVQIRQGDTLVSLAARMVSLGVIEAAKPLVDAASAHPDPEALRPGYARLKRRMNAAAAYAMLANPASRIMLSVDISPGLPVPEVLGVLSADTAYPVSQFASAVKDTTALNLPASAGGNPAGYLFPGMYHIQPDDSPTALLRDMIKRYDQVMQEDKLATTLKGSAQLEDRIITIASLIQAESGNTSYYPKISRVIYNRLAGKLKLDLDSTVAYAVGEYGRQPTQQERRTVSPYNTYLHSGLLPGPINNPGAAAIWAALHPANGDWIGMTRNPSTSTIQFSVPPPKKSGGGLWGNLFGWVVAAASAVPIVILEGGTE